MLCETILLLGDTNPPCAYYVCTISHIMSYDLQGE